MPFQLIISLKPLNTLSNDIKIQTPKSVFSKIKLFIVGKLNL